jgi:predicted Zn-dependent peptidase
MIECKTLPCGVRLVMEKIPQYQSASIGVWIGAGSSRENDKNNGVSHFIEHMFFQGTENRTALQLATDTDNLGCSMNAFTGKEATCFHIKALTSVFPQAVDILLDMLCHSLFAEKELRKERGVILEELNMVRDTPDDCIMDLLDAKVFRETPLARTVLGTKTSVRALHKDDILNYINTWYKTDNIVVSVVGNFDEVQLEEQLENALSSFTGTCPARKTASVKDGRRFGSLKKDINQTHIALGIPTIALDSSDYYPQLIVCDVLGGSMSSRLFQNIRERRGLAYNVYSATQSYAAGGMFFIYAGLTQGSEAEFLQAVSDEMKGLAEEGISEAQTEIVKQRMKSGFIFSLESTNSRMYRLGKNMLLLGRTYSEEETMAEISAVTCGQVNAFLQRVCDLSRYSGVAISGKNIDMKRLLHG